MDGFRTDTLAGAEPVVWMNNVADALVRGARSAAAPLFLRVSGARSAGVALVGNDFHRATRAVEVRDGPEGRVVESGNVARPAPK